MNGTVDDILNECIERLAAGETVEQCLASYPDHAVELEPMLRTSAATMNVAATITYRPEAKQRSRYNFTAAVADRQREANRGWLGRAIRPSGWRAKLARTAAVAVGIVVLGTGTAYGATVASEDSVPGDPLYVVKTLKEDISLRMPKSDLALAKEHAHLATVRTEEIGALIDRGNMEQADRQVVRVTYHLNSCAELVGVTITAHANPLEMPAGTTPTNREHRIAELVAYYEAKAQQVRNRFERRMRRLPPHRQWEAYLMMQQWELRHRMFLQALLYEGPPVWIVGIDPRSGPAQ
jgi:hypothetical protein